MSGKNIKETTVTLPSDWEILLKREFDLPRKLLFAAWTDPANPPHWMLGPDGWSMTQCKIDLREEGAWHFVWHHSNGTDMEIKGVYQEVVDGERLVTTESWGGEWPETINTVEFTEKKGKTTVAITMFFPSKAARDAVMNSGMAEGMALSYKRLESYLAGKTA
jgi:uncharacterized protein YndB with AHSA1/START domain